MLGDHKTAARSIIPLLAAQIDSYCTKLHQNKIRSNAKILIIIILFIIICVFDAPRHVRLKRPTGASQSSCLVEYNAPRAHVCTRACARTHANATQLFFSAQNPPYTIQCYGSRPDLVSHLASSQRPRAKHERATEYHLHGPAEVNRVTSLNCIIHKFQVQTCGYFCLCLSAISIKSHQKASPIRFQTTLNGSWPPART